jgi:hypothetical protein
MEEKPMNGFSGDQQPLSKIAFPANTISTYHFPRTKQGYTAYLNQCFAAMPVDDVVNELMYLVWAGLISEREIRKSYYKNRVAEVLRKHYSLLFEAGYANWLNRDN